MSAALDGVDVVGVGENHLVKGVGPLQRDFDIDTLAHAFEEDHVAAAASLPAVSDSTNSAIPPS